MASVRNSRPPTNLRVPGVSRGAPIVFVCDDEPIDAFEGETIAAAMLASGRRRLGETPRLGRPRGLFCAMGVCLECVVTVDGGPDVRACLTDVRHGMVVRSTTYRREQ